MNSNIISGEKERRYEIDWLRTIAIIILLYFHTAMLFTHFGWHIKNEEKSVVLDWMVAFFHSWRMPLLFIISGIGTGYALNYRSSGKYVGERTKRLFIPLVFGIFLVVAPQVYYERIDNYHSYFDFMTHFMEGSYPKGNFSWHHLWFILYLFLFSVLALPLFMFYRSGKAKWLNNFIYKTCSLPGGFLLFVIPVFLSQILLMPYFPEETHALFNDWRYFTGTFLLFVLGFLLFTVKDTWVKLREQNKINLFASLIAIVCWIANYFSPAGEWKSFGYLLTETMMAWFIPITLLGYSQVFLQFNSSFLQYANKAIYPFYILHQTAIVIVGYYFIKLDMNLWMKYILVSSLAGISSVFVYHYIIRPFKAMRFIFGVK